MVSTTTVRYSGLCPRLSSRPLVAAWSSILVSLSGLRESLQNGQRSLTENNFLLLLPKTCARSVPLGRLACLTNFLLSVMHAGGLSHVLICASSAKCGSIFRSCGGPSVRFDRRAARLFIMMLILVRGLHLVDVCELC